MKVGGARWTRPLRDRPRRLPARDTGHCGRDGWALRSPTRRLLILPRAPALAILYPPPLTQLFRQSSLSPIAATLFPSDTPQARTATEGHGNGECPRFVARGRDLAEEKSPMNQKRWKVPKMAMVVLLLAAMCASARAASEPAGLCKELRKLSGNRGGLSRYALWGVNDDRPGNVGQKLIPNIDIDGDDISDELLWLPQQSPSLIPSDPSSITIKTSKTGKEIRFEAMRFFLFKYHSKIFIEVSRPENIEEVNIYRVNPNGIELMCEKL